MTDEQRHDLAAIAAAIAAAGDNPSPFLLAERERLTREIERQEAREELAAAGGIPTAKIGEAVPGLPKAATPVKGLSPDLVDTEHPYHALSRQVGQAMARGGMGLVNQMGQFALEGGPVGAAIEQGAGVNPFRAVNEPAAKWIGDRLLGGAGRGQAAQDAWNRTGEQLDSSLATDLAKDPGALNAAKLGAIEVLAPSVPLGKGAIVAEKAARERPSWLLGSLSSAKDIVRDHAQAAAVAEEAGKQVIARMDSSLESVWEDIRGEMNVLKAKGGLAAADKKAIERAADGAWRGDSAALEAAAAALPEKFKPLVDRLNEVKDLIAGHQDEWARVTGATEEEIAKNSAARGSRARTAISAETDKAFHLYYNQNSEEWSKAVEHVRNMTGASAEEADHLLSQQARIGAKSVAGKDVEDGIKSLNTLSAQHASREYIDRWLHQVKKTPAERKVQKLDAILANLDPEQADPKLLASLQGDRAFAGIAADEAAALRNKTISEIIRFKKDSAADGIPNVLRQMRDPNSSLSKNRRLFEATLERLPPEVRKQIDWSRSQVVIDALGGAAHPTQNAQTALKTFITQVHNVRAGQALADGLGGRGVSSELFPGAVKIEHKWPGLEGKYVHRDLYPTVAMAMGGDAFEHASPALAAAAKVWAAAGKVSRVGAVNAITKAKLVALNTATLFTNAASSTANAIFNNPQAMFSAEGRDAIRTGLRTARRDANLMGLVKPAKLAYGDAPLVESKILKAFGIHTADDAELAVRQHTTVSTFNPSFGKQTQRMFIPSSARQLNDAGKALHYATQPLSQLVRAGGTILQYGDEIPRRITFFSELANQAKIHGLPATQEARDAMMREAGRVTEQVTATVSEMHPGIQQAIRDAPVLSFATYPADIVTRLWYTTGKQALSEIADGVSGKVANPAASIAVGTKRLAGLAAMFSMGELVHMGVNLLGGDQDKKKNEAIARQSGRPGDTMLTLPTSEKNMQRTVDVSRVNTYAPLVSALNAAGQVLDGSSHEDPSIDRAMQEFASGLASQFDSLQPAGKTLAESIAGRADNKELWPADATAVEKLKGGAGHFLGQTIQPVGGAKLAINTLLGIKPKVSSPGPIPTERVTNIARAFDMELSRAEDALRDRRSMDRNAGDLTDRPEFNASLQRVWTLVQDYRDMGLSEDDIANALRRHFDPQSRFGAQVLRSLMGAPSAPFTPALPDSLPPPDPRSPW